MHQGFFLTLFRWTSCFNSV